MPRRDDALEYHTQGRPGKIAIRPTKPLATQRDLSLAYSPGVAEPCRAIAAEPDRVYDYTAKGNLVAVVTNGTAVLGLGNIGPAASKPVMEGKGVLFKRFADIDVFDLEVDAQDPDRFIEVVAALEPTFGGINLEDIKAPESFHIEETLRERMSIPVFHDDQHGTAIIAMAGVVNALKLVDKALDQVRCVFSGAGAAAIACARLMVEMGVPREHITLCDSRGVIHVGRDAGMNPYKERFAVETEARTLADALVGADVFIGVSLGGIVSPEMVQSMAPRPIVFALANPDPEIAYPDAKAACPDAIVATGRSDYPNQVNNVLGFPFIFRGALDTHATTINEAMKQAAVRALAQLAREEVPDAVKRAYDLTDLEFGPDYIIPKPFDDRALLRVAPAVARAAMESGVARRPITDWDAYRARLERILGSERAAIRRVINKAALSPQRIVFPDGDHPRVLRAAHIVRDEGIAQPILLGAEDAIRAEARELGLSLDGITLIDHRDDPRMDAYIDTFWRRHQRRGVDRELARRRLARRDYFGVMMVEQGHADGALVGISRSYPESVRVALNVVGTRGDARVAGAALLILPEGGVKLISDVTMTIEPSAEDLAEIAISTARLARSLDLEPRVAMLSFSNFGSNNAPQAARVRRATALARKLDPSLDLDGEMQVSSALNTHLRGRLFPFSTLHGDANVLIAPDLNSGNIGYKLVQHLAGAELVGPILVGMGRPVNILSRDTEVNTIVALTAVTSVQAQRASD